MDELINKVAKSGLRTIDLEEWFTESKIVEIDLAPILWQGIALKELDFRLFLKEYPKETLQGSYVHIFCSEDVILPQWTPILITSEFYGYCEGLIWGNTNSLVNEVLLLLINKLNLSEYLDQRLVIKGCNKLSIKAPVYVALTNKLRPVAKSIMYGEPCSTVPIYKRK